MKRFCCVLLVLLCLSFTALADTLSPGTWTIGTDLSSGYWLIRPSDGEILLITLIQPGKDTLSLILTGPQYPFDGSKVTTSINLELTDESKLTIIGGEAILEPGVESLVWVAKSGSKYHKVADCSKMKDPQSMTEAEALAAGKTACKNCCQ